MLSVSFSSPPVPLSDKLFSAIYKSVRKMKNYEYEDLIQKSQFYHTLKKTLAIQLSITKLFEMLLLRKHVVARLLVLNSDTDY